MSFVIGHAATVISLSLVLQFSATPVGAEQASRQLNDTGMTRCADAAGKLSSHCAGTGQDGETGRDVRFPFDRNGLGGFRFSKVCNSGELAGAGQCTADAVLGSKRNDWGCTMDLVTGLTWEIKTKDGGSRGLTTAYRYTEAEDFAFDVNQAGLCGANDWRLPTRYELQSILAYGNARQFGGNTKPMIDTKWFPNTSTYEQWTSSDRMDDKSNHFVVSFLLGTIRDETFGEMHRVRLVRAAERVFRGRYIANGSEVRDEAARLIWRRCTEGQVWSESSCAGSATLFTWRDSLIRALDEAARTGLPWRVPNVKELATLVNANVANPPTIDQLMFPDTPPGPFWASTPYAEKNVNTSESAWNIGFLRGSAGGSGLQSLPFSVRLVRDLD